MYIRMEKLKISVLAGTLSSKSEIRSKRFFFYFQMCGCVPCFPRFTAIFTGDVIFLGKFAYFSMKTYIITLLLEPFQRDVSKRGHKIVFIKKYSSLDYPCYFSISVGNQMTLITYGHFVCCPHQNHLSKMNLMRGHNRCCLRFNKKYK